MAPNIRETIFSWHLAYHENVRYKILLNFPVLFYQASSIAVDNQEVSKVLPAISALVTQGKA